MQGHTEHRPVAAPGETILDPVCGMEVAETSPHRLRLGEVEYRFCSGHCLERFTRHPEAFLEQGPGQGSSQGS